MPVYALRTHLPSINDHNDADTPMRAAPRTNITELARTAPFLPQRSIITFATKLPSRPPTVYTEVTTEKVASDIGIHVGRLRLVVKLGSDVGFPAQVSTA